MDRCGPHPRGSDLSLRAVRSPPGSRPECRDQFSQTGRLVPRPAETPVEQRALAAVVQRLVCNCLRKPGPVPARSRNGTLNLACPSLGKVLRTEHTLLACRVEAKSLQLQSAEHSLLV